MKYHRPEDGIANLRVEVVDELIRQTVRGRSDDIESDAVRLADRIKRVFKHALVRRFGNQEILERIGQAIRFIRGDLNYMLPDVVPPDLASEIGLHNDVAVVTDTATLLSFVRATESAKYSQIEEEDLRSKHARIILTLGIFGFLIEAVDDAVWAESDLLDLVHVVRYGATLRNVRVVAVIKHTEEVQLSGPKIKVAVVAKQTVRVFLEDAEAEAYEQAVLSQINGCDQVGLYAVKFIDRLCREAVVGNETFYVYTNARRKRLFAMIAKVRRSVKKPWHFLRDTRGVRDEVVAVRGIDGVVRVPTREDAVVWAQAISRQIFSLHGTVDETGKQERATHSGLDYWDHKIRGRIIREHDGFTIGGRFEWIVQPLVDSLYAQLSVVEEHHDVYAMRRVWLDMLPVLAPHREWGRPQRTEDTEEEVPQHLVDEFSRAKSRWLRIVRARLSI